MKVYLLPHVIFLKLFRKLILILCLTVGKFWKLLNAITNFPRVMLIKLIWNAIYEGELRYLDDIWTLHNFFWVLAFTKLKMKLHMILQKGVHVCSTMYVDKRHIHVFRVVWNSCEWRHLLKILKETYTFISFKLVYERIRYELIVIPWFLAYI